ncbi:hypothetical protein TNCV_2338601 [Trichonephila clavipes]|nr:hypothetical protein TNCV_2338601 [Trichonephila clavipes]
MHQGAISRVGRKSVDVTQRKRNASNIIRIESSVQKKYNYQHNPVTVRDSSSSNPKYALLGRPDGHTSQENDTEIQRKATEQLEIILMKY